MGIGFASRFAALPIRSAASPVRSRLLHLAALNTGGTLPEPDLWRTRNRREGGRLLPIGTAQLTLTGPFCGRSRTVKGTRSLSCRRRLSWSSGVGLRRADAGGGARATRTEVHGWLTLRGAL